VASDDYVKTGLPRRLRWTSAAVVPSAGVQQLISHLDPGKAWFLAKPADYAFPVPAKPISLWDKL
jgi:hypothetical protein